MDDSEVEITEIKSGHFSVKQLIDYVTKEVKKEFEWKVESWKKNEIIDSDIIKDLKKENEKLKEYILKDDLEGDNYENCALCAGKLMVNELMIGCGDGSGNKFAHEGCWYKREVKELEKIINGLKKENEELKSEIIELKRPYYDADGCAVSSDDYIDMLKRTIEMAVYDDKNYRKELDNWKQDVRDADKENDKLVTENEELKKKYEDLNVEHELVIKEFSKCIHNSPQILDKEIMEKALCKENKTLRKALDVCIDENKKLKEKNHELESYKKRFEDLKDVLEVHFGSINF